MVTFTVAVPPFLGNVTFTGWTEKVHGTVLTAIAVVAVTF